MKNIPILKDNFLNKSCVEEDFTNINHTEAKNIQT